MIEDFLKYLLGPDIWALGLLWIVAVVVWATAYGMCKLFNILAD